ncbi:MAG: ABC transporter ATP-binding protein, partial [Conexibacteraceae bacterium]|nr:ABC transporter ATP-binding protein [Conexibacteraceae bacterium]
MTTQLSVRIRDARKTFGARVVIDGLDLDIEAGEFVALLGKSGSGKTTLLRVLAGLEELDEGEILVPTVRTTVFQEPRLVPSKRAIANVLLGQPRSRANKADALAALEEVGLGTHVRNWPSTLSGGEAQRVALARALVRKPDLLLLDEPFAALDALTRLTMHELVISLLQRHSPAALIVTHDVDESIALADRVLVLTGGRISLDLPVAIARPRDRRDPR